MANRRMIVLVAAGAAVVAGLVVGGVVLGTSGVFAPDVNEAVVEDPRWDEVSPGLGPDTGVDPDRTGTGPETDSGQPTGSEICWVFSGGGWIGGPCPPGADD